MIGQPTLFDKPPRAKKSWTSRNAAEVVAPHFTARQERYLAALRRHGPATDHVMAHVTGLPLSSVCSVRNALVRRGFVRDAKQCVVGPCGVWNEMWETVPGT